MLLLVTCRVVIERRRAALCDSNRWRWLRHVNDAPRALCKQCGCSDDEWMTLAAGEWASQGRNKRKQKLNQRSSAALESRARSRSKGRKRALKLAYTGT